MISVLYIDDEQGLLDIARSFLERSGEFRVVTLTSAQEALDTHPILSYDAIISDYQMPGMDGIAFLKAVRERSGDVPFILFTGRGREEIVIEAINNGANFYLQKGGDPKAQFAELAHKIRQAVRMHRTQVSLAEKEQRYHDLQNASDMIQSVAPDGHFLFVNKKWQDTLGYEEHELANITIFDIIHEESQEHCKQIFPRLMAGENIGIIDAIFKAKSGKKVYVEGISSCKITDGQPQYTREIFKDVTERKRAASALHESEEKFRTLVEYSLDAILITDFKGTILFANRAVGSIVDIPDYETMFKKRNVLEFIAPESRANVLHDLNNVAQGNDAYLVHYKFISETMREGWIECLGKKIPYKDSSVMFVSIRDITDRKRAEAAVRESESKFRGIFEISPYPIAITSVPDMKFLEVNAAFLKTSGFTEAEILGKNPRELGIYSHKDIEQLSSYLSSSGKIENVPLVPRGKDGIGIPIQYSAIPFTINDQPALLSMSTDISQLKRVEEELRQKHEDLNAAFEEITATEEELRQYNDELMKNEEVLRASEEKFRSLVEYSLEGILILDLQGQILFANNAAVRAIEVDPCAGLAGRNVMEFIAPESRQDVMRDFAEVATGHDAYLAQYQVITATGRRIYIESIGRIITYEGKTANLISIRDITERKATEAAYRAIGSSMAATTGLNALQKLTESISTWLGCECVMIGEIQPDNETVKTLAMLLDGKEVSDFTYTLKGTPCGDVKEKGFCLYQDNVRQLFPESKDLSKLNIRGYMGTTLQDPAGKVLGILCALSRNPFQPSPAVQEIMETIALKAATEIDRLQIERTLVESEAKFRTLVESSLDGILIVDMTGTILFRNRAAAGIVDTMIHPDRAGTKNVLDFVAPESRAQVIHDFNQIAHGIDSNPMNYQAITTTGRKIWIECIGKHIGFHHAPAALISLREISDRKLAEDALRQANKKLNLLSGITRHDINNQLQILNGFVELLHRKVPEPSFEKYFSGITKSSNQITAMIAFTKEYEKIGVHAPVWQNIHTLVNNSATGITLGEVTLKNDLPTMTEVFVDPLIIKVFFNLIDNALRHGGEVKTTRFSLESRNGDRIIVCEDDGAGIPDEEKERIFDLGFGKNTGFGLAISREILDITGITIREVGEPGKGARFEIAVPEGAFRIASGN